MGFIRWPSLKRSWANRTSLKFQLVHRLGAKMPRGLGGLRDPSRAVYNYVYNRTTVSLYDSLRFIFGRKKP